MTWTAIARIAARILTSRRAKAFFGSSARHTLTAGAGWRATGHRAIPRWLWPEEPRSSVTDL